jgi:hypothetical protein
VLPVVAAHPATFQVTFGQTPPQHRLPSSKLSLVICEEGERLPLEQNKQVTTIPPPQRWMPETNVEGNDLLVTLVLGFFVFACHHMVSFNVLSISIIP